MCHSVHLYHTLCPAWLNDRILSMFKEIGKMSNRTPIIPLPTIPAHPTMPLMAGFPPKIVCFIASSPAKHPPVSETKMPSKVLVNIAVELCKGCELCVFACPSGNLVLSDQLNRSGYHPAVFSYEGTRGPCSGCGICYWVCPDFSISEIRRLK